MTFENDGDIFWLTGLKKHQITLHIVDLKVIFNEKIWIAKMSISQPAGRRSKIAIIADILRLLRLGETGKVEIMYTGKLGYHITPKYITLLLESGLMTEITKRPDEINYRITQKGLDFLSQIESLQEMLHVDESLDIFRQPELMKKIAEGKGIVERLNLKKP